MQPTTEPLLSACAGANELLRAEDSFRAIFVRALDALLVADRETKQLLAGNPAACRLLGAAPEEIPGLTVRDIHPAEDMERVMAIFERQARREQGVAPNVPVLRRDGTIVFADIHSCPVILGGRDCVLGIFRDVTEVRGSQVFQQQTELLVCLGTLVAGVAHELNNPLTYVLHHLDCLDQELGGSLDGAGGVPPQKVESFHERARQALEGVRRMAGIIGELRVFQRLDRGPPKAVPLDEALDTAARLAGNEIRHCAMLVKEYREVPRVQAHFGQLSQVFLNLLVNAAHAIEAGAVRENHITVRCSVVGDEAVVEIEDSGCGIPEEALSRIFEPFFSTKPSELGSGLGLPISRRIIRELEGEIEVESTPGVGTCFRVRLPATQEEDAAASPLLRDGAGLPLPERRRSPLQAGRVLVVDDEPQIVHILRSCLGAHHEVRCAASGAEALEILAEDLDFDVVVTDLMMPDVSGQTLYEELQRRAPDLAERTVFITGGAFTASARDFVAGIPNPRFDKPLDFQALCRLVHQLVGSAP